MLKKRATCYFIAMLAAMLLLCSCSVPEVSAQVVSPPPTSIVEAEQTPPAAEHTTVPTVEPTPEPTPLPGEPYIVCANELWLRSSAEKKGTKKGEEGSNILFLMYYNTKIRLLEKGDEYSRIMITDTEQTGYCATEFIVSEDEMLYGFLAPVYQTKTQKDLKTGKTILNSDGTEKIFKNELVDLRLYLPDAQYNLLFATEKNVTGAPIYKRAIPFIQKETAAKLQKAYEIFKSDGYTMLIYDAYRPLSAQKVLYDIVQQAHWIANPYTTGSNHNRGAAVDLSLIGPDGNELVFPTPMHTFTEEAARTSDTWSEEASENVLYMTNVMKKCGFNSIKSEWWHFSDKNAHAYPITDVDFNDAWLRTADFGENGDAEASASANP